MSAWPETDIEKMTKGWSKAMEFSKARLQRVHDLAEDQLDDAIKAGHLVLENVCLFMHACVKRGQYRYESPLERGWSSANQCYSPPLGFWQVLHSEYGIVVYPSAWQEDINIPGMGVDVTFTEAYHGHISKLTIPFS